MGWFEDAKQKAQEVAAVLQEAKDSGQLEAAVEMAKQTAKQIKEEGPNGPTAQAVKDLAKGAIESLKPPKPPKQ